MGFTNFRVRVVLRVLLLLGNVFLLMWGYLQTSWQMTLLASATLLVLQIVELVHYTEASNRHFTAFLDAINAHDFSTRYNLSGKGVSFGALGKAFNTITLAMQQINTERAAQHQLLEALIEHISIALLCIDKNGEITLMNQSAKRLFNFPYISHTHALGKVDAQLPTLVRDAVPGQSQLINLTLGGQVQPLSMFTTRFALLDSSYSLVSLQNIREELESREVDSWQKLIKVLTHEIMNSITPIVSLSTVIKQTLVNDGQLAAAMLSTEESADLVRSLLAIETRGKGLMRFVQSYTNLANVPKPYFTDVAVAALLERLRLLLQGEMQTAGIGLQTRCEPDSLMLNADVQQVEQILINLLKNAREAIGDKTGGRIAVDAYGNERGEVTITVTDNGAGVAPDKLQDIFIPFYTTRKEGSGIGLSISRQLMLANKGHIAVSSAAGVGSQFTLVFRQT